jgi:NAD(P)H dehydrogenase (quinone)
LIILLFSLSFAHDSLKVSIFYYSRSGHTRMLAEAVRAGAASVDGISVRLLSVDKAESSDVLAADAIIVGSPVHKGNISLPVMQFINNWPFEGTPLKDKIGAAFVSAGGFSAGEELVQMNIIQAMLINRMIIVGGPEWQGAFGASAITAEKPFDAEEDEVKVHPLFLEKAKALGRRVAEITKRFNGR